MGLVSGKLGCKHVAHMAVKHMVRTAPCHRLHLQGQEGQEGQACLQSVSRLDAPTSGALVVPLSPGAAEDLKDRFATRAVPGPLDISMAVAGSCRF